MNELIGGVVSIIGAIMCGAALLWAAGCTLFALVVLTLRGDALAGLLLLALVGLAFILIGAIISGGGA